MHTVFTVTSNKNWKINVIFSFVKDSGFLSLCGFGDELAYIRPLMKFQQQKPQAEAKLCVKVQETASCKVEPNYGNALIPRRSGSGDVFFS